MFFIPDLHADASRLDRSLESIRQHERSEDLVVFLGDLIDNGKDNLAVITAVEERIRSGSALCLMGNHELNALLYHRRGQSCAATQDGFMRAHTASNMRQHASFLKEIEGQERVKHQVLDFFLDLPLFHETEDFRAVHACWDQDAIDLVHARRPDARLREEDLQEIALEESDFAQAVLTLLKGPEMDLPEGFFYRDHYGTPRTRARMNWWSADAATYRAAALSVPDPEAVPDLSLPVRLARQVRPVIGKPVVFGHYKMRKLPDLAENALCLDVPAQTLVLDLHGRERGLLLPDCTHLPAFT